MSFHGNSFLINFNGLFKFNILFKVLYSIKTKTSKKLKKKWEIEFQYTKYSQKRLTLKNVIKS